MSEVPKSIKESLDYCVATFYQKLIDKYGFVLISQTISGMGGINEYRNDFFLLQVIYDKGVIDGILGAAFDNDQFEINILPALIGHQQQMDVWERRKLLAWNLSCEEEASFIEDHYDILKSLFSKWNIEQTKELINRLLKEKSDFLSPDSNKTIYVSGNYMTSQQAQSFGRAKTLRATAIIAAIFLVVFMFMETRGDFANGILFFLEAVTNIHFIIILGILFGLTFLFGGKAGKEIIIDKRNFVVTSIKYVVLIILAIILYAATIGIVRDSGSTRNFQELLVRYFLSPLNKTGGLAIIPLLLIWLRATYQMRLLEIKEKTK